MSLHSTPTQRASAEETVSRSRRRRTSPRLPGMRRNARRVPTAQRVRTFYRLFRKLVRWVGPLVVLAVLFLVVRTSWQLFSQSKMFALKKVEYKASPRLSKASLMQFSGIAYNSNLLSLDLAALTRRIRRHPQVQSVRIVRKLPHTLVISVKTHTPVAVAVMGSARYLLNAKGRAFARLHAPNKEKLLSISGIRRTDYEQFPKASQQRFREAMALAMHYAKRKLEQFQPLREIQYDPILGYILRTKTGQVFLGRKRFPERIKQLERLYRLFWRRGVRQFRYVYLNHRRHPNRAIVRLGDAVLVRPQIAPKPPKPRKPSLH